MIEKISIHNVINGLMFTGRYKCFDRQDDLTLNLGYGEIDVIHISKELMKGNDSCQFVFHNHSVYFRVVSNSFIKFVPLDIELTQIGNESFQLNLSDAPISIRRLFHEYIGVIQINGCDVTLLEKTNTSTNNEIISPFKKKTRDDFDVISSPFRKTRNEVIIPKNKLVGSQKTIYSNLNIKISSNNKNSVKNKEEKDGLFL